MTSTPPPPPESTASTPGDDDDWRNSVLQSYRNDEVREIAKVLAALEPGEVSTSSKLMLAMRFEDAIFKSATSLADYRKRLTKRLKKLQKNYVPPVQQTQSHKEIEEQLLLEMRQTYSESLNYIATNASKAIQDVKTRLGTERSVQLQQHTDSAIAWAKELGVLPSQLDNNSSTNTKQPGHHLSEGHLRKLQQHLERRVENIRQYVVKHADPDLFLKETLERKDQELPPRACNLLGVNLSKRIQQLQQNISNSDTASSENNKFDAMATLQEQLEKAQTPVPPPTRNNANDLPAALLHLDKMRAASTALMAYVAITDRKTTAPRQALAKAHGIATQGMEFVLQVAQAQTKAHKKEEVVSLPDAWSKTLELPLEEVPLITEDNSSPSTTTTTKKPKLDHLPPVTKSRVLLTPKRRTPPNLIPALKRKQAKLIRPKPDGQGSHLILTFGKAFAMTIYFCPLVVTIRALQDNETDQESSDNKDNTLGDGSASWTPLYHGLADKKEQDVLTVWGVTGSYESIGHVVEERLRDASTHATHILRKCFANHVKDKTAELDVELLEASALLEFLQLARTTYIPKWQDQEEDVVVS